MKYFFTFTCTNLYFKILNMYFGLLIFEYRLTYSYTALWFFVPIYCWFIDKYHSQFIEYQENKQPRKISEREICAYTRMSEKWGPSHRNPEKKWVIHILFVEKRGPIIHLAALKRGPFGTHIRSMPYIVSYTPTIPPPSPTPPSIATADMQMLCNIFPVLSSQLMKRSSFKQFLILRKNIIYGMTVNEAWSFEQTLNHISTVGSMWNLVAIG